MMIVMRFAWVLMAAGLAGCERAQPPDEAPTAADRTVNVDTRKRADPDATVSDQASAAPAEDPQARQQRMELATASKDWTPEALDTNAESVGAALDQAGQALEQGRLIDVRDGALALYLYVLRIEPDNSLAAAGVDSVVELLLVKAQTMLAEGRVDDAAKREAVLRHLRPDDSRVAELSAQVRAGQTVVFLLDEAAQWEEAGVLLTADGGSPGAITAYQQVLEIDAANSAAASGLARIEAGLVAAALAAAARSDYEEADQRLANAARVGTGSGAVQDASTRIVELRQQRAAQIVAEANARIMSGDLDRATELLGALEEVSAQSEGIEDLRSRIENARLYGGFEPGQSVRDLLRSGSAGPELVVIPVGSFLMGSRASEVDRRLVEGPQHNVNFARGFAVAVRETSVAEFRAFVQASGYRPASVGARGSTIYDENSGSMIERRGVTWENDHGGRRAADDLPVIHVSWGDAIAYAGWLTSETGKGYRLPTEAEFEYVLRAGSDTRFPWGDGAPSRVVDNMTGDGDRSISRRTWVNAFESYSDGHWGPAPVDLYPANPFGVQSVIGNVSEWVEDCWHDSFRRAPNDGSAWVNDGCSRRVIRGASWASAPDQVRSAHRLNAAPATTNARLGFRVARSLD